MLLAAVVGSGIVAERRKRKRGDTAPCQHDRDRCAACGSDCDVWLDFRTRSARKLRRRGVDIDSTSGSVPFGPRDAVRLARTRAATPFLSISWRMGRVIQRSVFRHHEVRAPGAVTQTRDRRDRTGIEFVRRGSSRPDCRRGTASPRLRGSASSRPRSSRNATLRRRD